MNIKVRKNPENPYRYQLKILRKYCAQIAYNNLKDIEIYTEKKEKNMSSFSKGKYINLWRSILNEIENKIKDSVQPQSIQLDEKDFKNVGNRSSYSFNLEFKDGQIINNIRGSAVARDLARYPFGEVHIDFLNEACN
ncbi:hypothetical protein ACX8XP_11670 [Calditrichota bacterium LG25]